MVKGFKDRTGKFHPTNATVNQLSDKIKEIEGIRNTLGQQSSELFSKDEGTEIKKVMLILEQKKKDIQEDIAKKRESKEDVKDALAQKLNKHLPKDELPFPVRDRNITIESIKNDGTVVFVVKSGSGAEESVKELARKAGFKFIKDDKILDLVRSTFEGKP